MTKYDWSKTRIEEAVKRNYSYSDVLRDLNIPTSGNNGSTLRKKIQEYNIDISHFTHTSQKKRDATYIKAENYFRKGSQIKSFKLKSKLLREGIKENKCEICGITEWQGKALIMQLHHIDGDPTNNVLENLQMLCPNCHSQTDNFCGSANKTEKPKYYCQECGIEIKTNATYCPSCSAKHNRRANWPNEVENIRKYIADGLTNVAIGKIYKVSDSTIRKVRNKYNI